MVVSKLDYLQTKGSARGKGRVLEAGSERSLAWQMAP